MARLKAVLAKDLSDLEVHVNKAEPVILIFNDKLIPEIKKRVKEDQDNRKSMHIFKGLAVAGAGLYFIPVVGMFTAAIYGATVIGGLLASANRIWKKINAKLGEYTWSESEIEGTSVLVLTKSFGENSLNIYDEVDYTDLINILNNERRRKVMVIIKPVLAKDLESLEMYVSNSNKVILITDEKLIPQVKKKVKEDTKNSNGINILKGLAIYGIGAVAMPVAGSVMALFAASSAVIAGLAMSANQIQKRLHVKLQDYTWTETALPNGKNLLVLTKTKGENKITPLDEVDEEESKRLSEILEEKEN